MTMPPEVAAEAAIGLLALAALVIFWFGPRRWVATDYARNEMFAAREEFFDEAVSGRVSFNDPNYRRVREAINSNIRFAHAISIVRIVLHLRGMARQQGKRASSDARDAAEAIANPTARWVARQSLNKVETAALHLLFWRSPFLGIVLLAWLFASRPGWRDQSSIRQFIRAVLKPYSDAIQAEALMA
jgi:hypothetical protein